MKDLRTIILAAGKGTRMRSSIPKVLHPICGQPMIDYIVDVAKKASSLKIYVVLGHQYESVRKHLSTSIVTIRQKRLLGTADAVRCASSFLKGYRGDVLILCGDTPLLTDTSIKRLIHHHRSRKAICTVLTAIVDNPWGYGRIIRNRANDIVAIREEKDASGQERLISEINVGVYCFYWPELLKTIRHIELNQKKKEFYITDIIELFVAQGLAVTTVQTENGREGLGINTREDLSLATSILRQRILKKFMAEGVTIVDPFTTYIETQVTIGQDTVVRPFTVIENNVTIGRRCLIGPFTHLRPGTRVADEVEIGNFAEVSRTHVGQRSIMKHFSFLGDARIGSQVNIGAGTVTANYDGKNKNKTYIANRAFIGSDSILIAPVHVGQKAITAAGSVVTKGTKIPAKTIAMGVPARLLKRKKIS